MNRSLHIGTSGFSYPEWVEAGIYPAGTKSADMLPLYSSEFSIVELNYSWYQMVRSDIVERMLSRVPSSFLFTSKLTRTMTHEIADDWRGQARAYCRGIRPLLKNRLLGVLVQFPASFTRSQANRYYLAGLLDALSPLPLAVEFRHRSWAHDRVFKGLTERKVTLVTVDAPPLPELFPCMDVVTNPDLLYYRLHGRNISGWYSGTMQQRFNYAYSDQELRRLRDSLILPMAGQCSGGVVFFNNHVAGQAVRNARTFKALSG